MKRVTILIAALAALVLAACGAQPKTQEATIEAKDIAYGTTTLEVVAGQPVRLTLKDIGTLDHDFSIMEIPIVVNAEAQPMAGHDMSGMSGTDVEPQLHVAAMAGGSNTIEFTPTKPGTYEFICTVVGHKEAGMVGKLIVKEP